MLTLVLRSLPEEGDSLDTSGENKRTMIAAADNILDAAIARMPGYLSNLPVSSRPSLEQLSQALRRDYRIKGPQVEVDISFRSSQLPAPLLASVNGQARLRRPVPGIVLAFSRLTGWVFGVGKQDQNKVIDQVHKEFIEREREILVHKVSTGLAELFGVALEIEVVNQTPALTKTQAIRQVSIRRGM